MKKRSRPFKVAVAQRPTVTRDRQQAGAGLRAERHEDRGRRPGRVRRQGLDGAPGHDRLQAFHQPGRLPRDGDDGHGIARLGGVAQGEDAAPAGRAQPRIHLEATRGGDHGAGDRRGERPRAERREDQIGLEGLSGRRQRAGEGAIGSLQARDPATQAKRHALGLELPGQRRREPGRVAGEQARRGREQGHRLLRISGRDLPGQFDADSATADDGDGTRGSERLMRGAAFLGERFARGRLRLEGLGVGRAGRGDDDVALDRAPIGQPRPPQLGSAN
jgi:hypothetical protein